ncbi:17626_t:CDS:1, partial [Gigaspora rosea]
FSTNTSILAIFTLTQLAIQNKTNWNGIAKIFAMIYLTNQTEDHHAFFGTAMIKLDCRVRSSFQD